MRFKAKMAHNSVFSLEKMLMKENIGGKEIRQE